MPNPDHHATATRVIGLLADPAAPTRLATRLAETLPVRLADGDADGSRATVEVVSEPFTTGTEDAPTLLRRIEDKAGERHWDIAVGLTELPLQSERRYLVADVNSGTRSALVSLPALGGLRLHSAALRAVSDLVAELAAHDSTRADDVTASTDIKDVLAGPLSPIRGGSTAEGEAANLRFVAPGVRGRLRLLAGMVRTNQPWKLVPGLSKALAAALATGAIATVNSTVWLLSSSLSVNRVALAMVGSIVLMVSWLIIDAGLWHHPDDESRDRLEKRALYNASTVLTVTCGVLICYVALYLINLLWALFIVNGQAFEQMVSQPMSGSQYLVLTWLVTSAATVGGALGSGLESDEAVRAAAFGKREQERRQMLEEQHRQGTDPS
jgi:hypothetical protein